jgi:hypothetical protein
MSTIPVTDTSLQTPRNTIEPLLLKIEQVAAQLNRSHWSLREDVAAGRLRCVRIGRRIYFEPAEIQRFIEENRQ